MAWINCAEYFAKGCHIRLTVMMGTDRFRQSQAVDFYWNLELVKRRVLRESKVHPNIVIYESAFDLLNPIQVSHALSLAKALALDKRVEVFWGNTSLVVVDVCDVLQCYQHSMQVGDHRAHCWLKLRFTLHLTVARLEVAADESTKSFVFPVDMRPGVHDVHPGMV